MSYAVKVSELTIACDCQTEIAKKWLYIFYQPILLSLK
tara:strand:- start:17 stop:130 length:114 start_codon:yes stop_codon:yes gene_type:complete